jgi:iron(III) transport system ATP-binding protein
MIAGLEQNDTGLIAIGDRVVSDPAAGLFVAPERREIGMVFQSYAIWPHMTVFGNVAYPLEVRHRSAAEVRECVLGALRLMEMEHLADRPPTALSGGQQQRVAIARSLVFQPRVLLMDEPLSNLDAKLRESMRVEIRAPSSGSGSPRST